MNWLSSD